ncbi:MAG TPA: right-handed parallel beta-helix repeat-containing protein [Armatimonadota bacterium]|jgi:hypothetical protein
MLLDFPFLQRAALAVCALGASMAACQAKVVYVNGSGTGSVHDGMTWQTAYRSFNAALATISPGDEVWVAAGAYPGNGVIGNGATYLGGFAGGETSRDERDPRKNVTTVGDPLAESAFSADVSVTQTATIDGFTITAGQGRYIGGAYVAGAIQSEGANLAISGNVIAGNDIDHKNNNSYGGGIYCNEGRVAIRNNTIVGNRAANGAAIFSSGAALTVTGNIIRGNHGARQYMSRGSGICVYFTEQPVVIADNIIDANDLDGIGGGIYCSSSSATVTGNTIVGNAATWPGAAIHVLGSATIANNIVAFNTDGIALNQGASTLGHNDVYGNVGPAYPDAADPTGTNGNISADPLFINTSTGNYRLQAGSPCKDTGNDAFATPGETDVAGHPRVSGAHTDMGAYEYNSAGPAPYTMADAAKALRIAAGLVTAQQEDALRFRNSSPLSQGIDVTDAVRVTRAVVGLDA